jgi:G:T-mismatch repair DNA endonuclease (very short patch repair protein)
MCRDRANTRTLRAKGWSVIRLWEHDLSPTVRIPALTKLLIRLRNAR